MSIVNMISNMIMFIVKIKVGFSKLVRNNVWCFSFCVLFCVVCFNIVGRLFVVFFEWIKCISIGGNWFCVVNVCVSEVFFCMCVDVFFMLVLSVMLFSVLFVVCNFCKIGMLVFVRIVSVFVNCVVL